MVPETTSPSTSTFGDARRPARVDCFRVGAIRWKGRRDERGSAKSRADRELQRRRWKPRRLASSNGDSAIRARTACETLTGAAVGRKTADERPLELVAGARANDGRHGTPSSRNLLVWMDANRRLRRDEGDEVRAEDAKRSAIRIPLDANRDGSEQAADVRGCTECNQCAAQPNNVTNGFPQAPLPAPVVCCTAPGKAGRSSQCDRASLVLVGGSEKKRLCGLRMHARAARGRSSPSRAANRSRMVRDVMANPQPCPTWKARQVGAPASPG